MLVDTTRSVLKTSKFISTPVQKCTSVPGCTGTGTVLVHVLWYTVHPVLRYLRTADWTVSEKSILNAGTIQYLLVNRLDSAGTPVGTAGMGALGLNMDPEGRNIAAYAPKESTGGSLQCVSSPLRPRIARAGSVARGARWCGGAPDQLSFLLELVACTGSRSSRRCAHTPSKSGHTWLRSSLSTITGWWTRLVPFCGTGTAQQPRDLTPGA